MKTGPNPERYTRLAEPISEARANSAAFLSEVDKIREKYHLSDLVLCGVIQVLPKDVPIEDMPDPVEADENGRVEPRSSALPVICRWGSPQTAAHIGKILYEAYTRPEVERLRELEVK